MKIHSLGYRTDLLFIRFDGEVIDRGHYLVCRTPANPHFYWGNFILFSEPPRPGQLETFKEIFAEEIGVPPHANHIAFGFDGTSCDTGKITPFIKDGFHLDEILVLSAKNLIPPRKNNPELTIRPLEQKWEFDACLEIKMLCREPQYEENGYREFSKKQIRRYQQMIDSGLGVLFGAFIGQQLVGDLGIFAFEDLARYQSVQTHPDFRRRGICSALVYAAGCYAFENHEVKSLVICTEVTNQAASVYKSVGLLPTEKQIGVTKHPLL